IERIEPRWLTRNNSAAAIAERMSEFIDGKLPAHSSAEVRSFVQTNYNETEALEKFVTAAVEADLGEMQLLQRHSTQS
ncbi:MAG: hypothetical protein JWO13_2089, partial [Acidobacteriales bacterium]|nr:hypothetical protein [Terriglobales bacterium]